MVIWHLLSVFWLAFYRPACLPTGEADRSAGPVCLQSGQTGEAYGRPIEYLLGRLQSGPVRFNVLGSACSTQTEPELAPLALESDRNFLEAIPNTMIIFGESLSTQ